MPRSRARGLRWIWALPGGDLSPTYARTLPTGRSDGRRTPIARHLGVMNRGWNSRSDRSTASKFGELRGTSPRRINARLACAADGSRVFLFHARYDHERRGGAHGRGTELGKHRGHGWVSHGSPGSLVVRMDFSRCRTRTICRSASHLRDSPLPRHTGPSADGWSV
jgi:hypothetical protein